MTIEDTDGKSTPTVAMANMYVNLPHDVKGTHMSRFVDLLNRETGHFSAQSLLNLLNEQADKLEAESALIELQFPFFVEKAAPVSGVKSLMDYDVTWTGELSDGEASITTKVVVPVTSLCPCSKKISDYGAHNQRSHVTITLKTTSPFGIREIAEIVESEAPCELWAGLKRPDEKYVTEKAYDNPKFVEDMVRDIAGRFYDDERVNALTVESENFESIHNHSAYALIKRTK
jgi:GTP cyclohydrolase I